MSEVDPFASRPGEAGHQDAAPAADAFATEPAAAPDPFSQGGSELFEFSPEPEEGLPPTGPYIARVVHIGKQVSKTSGNPMFVWEFQVMSDMQGGVAWRGFEPKPMYTVLTAAAMWRLDACCRALGLSENSEGKFSFGKQDVVGVACTINLEQDEYQGREQRTIGTVLAHPSGAGHREADDPLTSDGVPF